MILRKSENTLGFGFVQARMGFRINTLDFDGNFSRINGVPNRGH